MCPEKRSHSIFGLTLTNLNTVSYFFARIILVLQRIKILEHLAHVISDVIKTAVYRQRRTFNKRFSQGKTWDCKSIAKRVCERKLESSLIKSLSEKLINSVLFGSGRRRTWSRRHCLVQWRRAVAVSQHAALHIVNINFELN